ncbi:unnamed protein product [Clonostachys rosea f. rosea IK726]|uniref:Uncharacterized protein n=1 Tax=Clonostachys rosea f. rosea IK726 TaxID=1349383 RepID=A0ACA9U9A6_BIOOC|nr:unnamed protein product [Clonostachys rosea f. rosea IK726]
MAHSHQTFVIAGVDGLYRPIAALSHPDLSGMRALAQCHRQLQIFSHPSNRIALEAELFSAKTFFKTWTAPDPKRLSSSGYDLRSPFSFISTCLTVGSLHRTDGHPPAAIHELPFSLPFDDYQNGGGIIVIDITNLNKLKYCFAFTSRLRSRPLSARQYLLTYYSEHDKFLQEPRSVAIIRGLERWPIIDVVSLAGKPQTPVTGPRGLVEQTVDKMMKALQLSSSAVDLNTIKQEMSHFPGLKKLVQDWLCENSHLVDGSPTTLSLISLAYEGERILDWGYFPILDVSSLETLLQNPYFQNVHTIRLATPRASHNHPKRLWPVLSTLPNLKTVCLLDPLSVNGFVTCEPFVELAQSDLNIRLDKLTITAPFYHSMHEENWISDDTSPPLLTSSFPIAQLLIHHERSKIFDLAQYEYFTLGDALLSPVRLLTGLFQYMNMMRSLLFVAGGTTALNVAACFAASSSSLAPTQFGEIGPLPAQIYKYGLQAGRKVCHRGKFSSMRDLQPGQWTVLLRQIRSSTFQYAFVRARKMIRIKESIRARKPIEPEMIEVFTIEDFLRETAPEVDVGGVQNLYSQLLPEGFDTSSVLTLLDSQEACILLDEFVDKAEEVDFIKQFMGHPAQVVYIR